MIIILHRRRRFNWQVFLMAMLGVAFLLVFAYVPMFGIAIAFKNMDYSMNFMKDLVNKPWVGLENFAKFIHDAQFVYQQDNNAYYVPVTLRNAAGDDPVLGDISGWGYLQTVISASCKDPEKVIKFISYLVNDEGAIHLNKGWEGEHWNYNDDGTISRTQAYIDAVWPPYADAE